MHMPKTFNIGTLFTLLVGLICCIIPAVYGEEMLETCLALSPTLNAELNAEEKAQLVVTTDRFSAYFNERWIEYSYLGINGISFSLTIDHGVPSIQDDQTFLTQLRACQTAAVDLAEAEAVAKRYFERFLESESENPGYQAYIQHFGLERITAADCFFKPGFSVYKDECSEWLFTVYPVLACDELRDADAPETPYPFLQWALINADAKTGEITNFESDGCFRQWAGLFDEELIASIPGILRTDTSDFSMYTFKNGDYVNEWMVLGKLELMINEGVPMERLCPSFGYDEIVFKVLARHCLMWVKAYGRPPMISTMMELHWYPGAVEYAQINEPDTLRMLEELYSD